uniref:Putative secreted protein n=1 Tax=Anopheles darlingi TaxID=43151 RepID=A0A2M4D7E0_ANODA
MSQTRTCCLVHLLVHIWYYWEPNESQPVNDAMYLHSTTGGIPSTCLTPKHSRAPSPWCNPCHACDGLTFSATPSCSSTAFLQLTES